MPWLKRLRRVVDYSGRSPVHFYQGVVWSIAERVFDLLPFFIAYYWFTYVYVHVSNPGQSGLMGTLVTVIVCLLLVFLLQLVCGYYGHKLSFEGGYHIIAGYRERIINQVHRMPLGTLQHYRVGELTEVMIGDVKVLENMFTHLLADIIASVCSCVLLALVLLVFDWKLALVLLLPLPLAILVLEKLKRSFLRRSQEKQTLFAQVSGLVVEFIMGIRTLRLFDKSALWLEKIKSQLEQLKKNNLRVEALGGGAVTLFRMLVEMGLVAMLLLMAYQTNGEENVLAWLLFILLTHKLLQPLLSLPESITVFRFALESESRLQQLLDAPLLPEPSQLQLPTDFGISIQNVSFSYETHPVLHKISFTVAPGTLTAIVGPSGSGKSTLLNLLARFYDPQQGYILVGGVDIKMLGTQQLYSHMSMVFQQVQLYQGTIRENVAIGKPDATQQQVQQACRSAFCENFILALPQGYETLIGESGSGLSGGERQRLSIARALLKDAPILLLDEATASVDPIAQYEIQQALSCLAQGRTVVMVAHRLQTVRYAQQIIVLDKGRIVGCGRHGELLETNDLYRRLWQAQC